MASKFSPTDGNEIVTEPVDKPARSVFGRLRGEGAGKMIPRRRRVRKILLPLAIIAMGMAFAGYLRATRPPVERNPVRERVWIVSAMPVVLSNVQPNLRLYGEIVAGRKVDLRPLVAGRIVAVGAKFAAGGIVRNGDLLIRIDPFEYKSAVDERTALLNEAKARLEEYLSELVAEKRQIDGDKATLALRQRDAIRKSNLRARGSGSVKSSDDAKLALAQAEQKLIAREQSIARLGARSKQQSAVIERMKVSLERARRDLRETYLRAPFDGFLIEANGAIGKRVGTNDRIALLIDAKWLEAKFQVSDEEFGRLAAGGGYKNRPATVRWVTGGKTFSFSATIERVASQVDAKSGGVNLYARIAKTDIETVLRPGIFVEVVIKDRAYDKVVRLPVSALHQGKLVYVVVKGRLQARSVKIVARAGNDILVRGALRPDEIVLVSRFAEIGKGVRVEIK
ncbi:MAG: efflux RND transporter periplasmic adaptor subunit [Alphaproteobacteria bacterium]|nr:efflux RND transporter periplasmic adaptor subunit [Alphaproteobacteria bacterium]